MPAKKTPAKKAPAKKTPAKKPKQDIEQLKESIINEIQPKIQESFSVLKTDVLADIKETLVKLHKPNTETPAPATQAIPATPAPDMKGIQNVLKSVLGDKAGDLNVSDLSKLLPAAQGTAATQIPPGLELTKADYFKIRQQDQHMQLALTLIPLFLGQNQGGLPPQLLSLIHI